MSDRVFTAFLFALFFILPLAVKSQIQIRGKIIDAVTKKPIPNVDLTMPNAGVYTFSDEKGQFLLEAESEETVLEVTADYYEFKEIDLTKANLSNLKIELTPSSKMPTGGAMKLDEAVVSGAKKTYKNKRENPAWGIMRKVWERRKTNGLKEVPYYEYEEYEKLEFDFNNLDSTFTQHKAFKDVEFIFERIDTSDITGKNYLPVFFNEAIYKVYGTNVSGHKERKDLLANKNSGFEDNLLVIEATKNIHKEFDVYENRLNFFNINFVSPIARDGFAVYDYELSDTVVVDGVEAYHIKYQPKRAGEFTFKGDFYISTKSYAVKEISMASTKSLNVNFVRDVFVNQQFSVTDDDIFYPKRDYILFDMTLLDKSENAMGMFAQRTVLYNDFEFDKPLPDRFYTERDYDPLLEGAFEKSDEYWEESRHESLTENEEGIYEMLEELNEVPKFRRIKKTMEVLGSGYYNTEKGFDIGNFYHIMGFNKVEGMRLRLGARTYFTMNDMWRVGGYLAYGFKDKELKYGAEARFLLNRNNRFEVGIGAKKDIEQLGSQLTLSKGIMSRAFGSSAILSQGDNDKLSKQNLVNVYTSFEPWKNFTVRLDGDFQTITSAEESYFDISYLHNGQEHNKLTDTNISLTLIAQPGAKFAKYGIDRTQKYALTPMFLLRYTKGFSGLFGSQFNYDKIQFMYTQPVMLASFGRMYVNFETGKTFGGVPLSLMSVLPGNQSYNGVQGSFRQMDYYEFVTDAYATLMLEHHFQGWIFNKLPLIKKLKFREVVFIRTAWGDISDKSLEMNRSSIEYLAPKDHLYYEYGFGIENIGFGNIRPFRVDFNWRGNYLELPDVRKFGVTLGIDFLF